MTGLSDDVIKEMIIINERNNMSNDYARSTIAWHSGKREVYLESVIPTVYES